MSREKAQQLTGGEAARRKGGYPSSVVDNLRGIPEDWRACIAAEANAAVARFGLDPCTKAQAAAHEAGHIVIAHSIGKTIESARLTRHVLEGHVLWAGCNHYSCSREPILASPRHNPEAVLFSAAIELAGFTGEDIAGLSHPSSSIDERFKARQLCAAVARELVVPEHAILMRVTAFCLGTLQRNRIAFDVIRGHLHWTHRITHAEAKRMLAGVRQESVL